MRTYLREGNNRREISEARLGTEGVFYRKMSIDPEVYTPIVKGWGMAIHKHLVVSREMDDLEAHLAKVSAEHTHPTDEVRFILGGSSIFHIRSRDDVWMDIHVESGDLIVIPKDRYHCDSLTDEAMMKLILLRWNGLEHPERATHYRPGSRPRPRLPQGFPE
ncbi:MAG: acireductone dioxygenase [Proteobacteria bacterium]|nr:acireductone dioxygenase [Pseudomonadota bacterium]